MCTQPPGEGLSPPCFKAIHTIKPGTVPRLLKTRFSLCLLEVALFGSLNSPAANSQRCYLTCYTLARPSPYSPRLPPTLPIPPSFYHYIQYLIPIYQLSYLVITQNLLLFPPSSLTLRGLPVSFTVPTYLSLLGPYLSLSQRPLTWPYMPPFYRRQCHFYLQAKHSPLAICRVKLTCYPLCWTYMSLSYRETTPSPLLSSTGQPSVHLVSKNFDKLPP